jgi:hypothetical protein
MEVLPRRYLVHSRDQIVNCFLDKMAVLCAVLTAQNSRTAECVICFTVGGNILSMFSS